MAVTGADSAVPLILRGVLTESSLAGRSVLVTGGGGGIGLEAARSLLLLGAAVTVVEVDAALESRARSALAAGGDASRLLYLHADVSDPDGVAEAFAAAVARFGKV